jgi:hypothetical protein
MRSPGGPDRRCKSLAKHNLVLDKCDNRAPAAPARLCASTEAG